MISEWNNSMAIVSPYDTIDLNVLTDDGLFLVDTAASQVRVGVRAVVDDVSQGDGTVRHRRYLTGVEMLLAILLFEDEEQIACGTLRREMHDRLMGVQRSLLRAGDNQGRVLWTPDGADVRMLDDVQLREYALTSLEPRRAPTVTFLVDSPYPYAIDFTQTEPVIDGAGSLTNNGNADFWPVIKVYGPASAFTLTNLSALDALGNPLQIVYDASLPGGVPIGGGGEYAEIDTFRNTIYLNGDQANLKGGLDVLASDFWPVKPGVNSIVTDAESHFLLNDAWA